MSAPPMEKSAPTAPPPDYSNFANHSNQQAPTYPSNAYGGQPYQGQPYGAQPYPAQQYGAQPYPVQQYGAQPYPGQPYGGQPYNQPGYAAYPPPPPPPVEVLPADSDTMEHSHNTHFGGSFSDKRIRMAFIRKVYLILTAQLLVTTAIIAFFSLHKPTKYWIQHDGIIFYYISYATFLCTYIALMCCPSVRRRWPGNFICLIIFTLAFAYMVATIASFYSLESILIAAGITCLVCFSVSIFASQTKFDFTKCGGVLFVCCIVLLLFAIAISITYAVSPVDHRTRYVLQCVYGGLGALLFTAFLAYDTQLLIGGHKYQLSEEEHIFAAVQLYLDVVYIFVFLLSIFGSSK